ncbi:MAG: TPR end-of-group domain-containing protein [Pseudomonadota bacterium]
MERRLAAILAADVVGFSRLMGADEAATLAALRAHREELIDVAIAGHRGRIVSLAGDGILVEFPSVVEAVQCAAAIQHEMRRRNADVPPDRRLDFRIGVNLGDIISVGGDIYGDGVNVAARIESIARPGGVAVSATVRDHVSGKLGFIFEDRGEQSLKNISRPIRIFDMALGAQADASRLASAAGAAPLEASALSIVVLPFTNMSGDSEQEYFADGITEDIITDLAKIRSLSVIARNSAFTYKGRTPDLREVGRHFNVSYVLEGSVRRSGQRIRINAQLIDAKTGTHVWADRYDRDLTDIFVVQDEITKTVVGQLKVTLLPKEKSAIEMPATRNVEAYNHYLQGRHLYHLHTQQHVLLARRMFETALEIDPTYARAFAGLANCAWFLYVNQHEGAGIEAIHAASLRALELDPDLAEAHASHGVALHYQDRYPEAVAEFERAMALDPGLYEACTFYAMAARDRGDLETSAQMSERCIAIWPEDFREWLVLGQLYDDLGRPGEARRVCLVGIEMAERALVMRPDVPLPATLGAGALISLGERDRASQWLSRALTIAPDDPLTQFNAACAYSVLEEKEKALTLLESWAKKATAMTSRWLIDSDFEPIYDHPRFQKLLSQLGLPTGPFGTA